MCFYLAVHILFVNVLYFSKLLTKSETKEKDTSRKIVFKKAGQVI